MRKKLERVLGKKLGSCYDFLLEIEDFSDNVTSQLGHNLPVGRCWVGQVGFGNGRGWQVLAKKQGSAYLTPTSKLCLVYGYFSTFKEKHMMFGTDFLLKVHFFMCFSSIYFILLFF